MSEKTYTERVEVNDWSDVIREAKQRGYSGPDEVRNNRAKVYALAYLENRSIEVIFNKKYGNE